MVGLFLALLELIRDSLVSVEQRSKGSALLLKALTDEPPEQAVQRTIAQIKEDAEAEAAIKNGEEQQPPIPIAELPVERKKSADYEAVGLQGDDKRNEN